MSYMVNFIETGTQVLSDPKYGRLLLVLLTYFFR